MRVAYVTAGAAGMFCGSCMRDNTLVRTLRAEGCDVVLVPTFTPITVDEEDASFDRVFLGGVHVYLADRWAGFDRLPRALTRWLDRPGLLRAVSRRALQTRRDGDGRLAASLLEGERGRQRRAIEELVAFLADELRPDLVNVTNLLVAGFAPALRRRLDVPVLVTLQGDDVFLDALPEDERPAVLEGLRRVAAEVDGFVVFTDFYRDRMAELLRVPAARFHRVRLGLSEPEAFAPPGAAADDGAGDGTRPARDDLPERPPTVGYLARLCPEKGFGLLVEAFLRLRARPGMEAARLRFGGWVGARDRPFVERQRRRLEEAGAPFEQVDLPDRAAKARFLHGLDVFSVPAVYREPKGLFLLEALAAGVPAVEPEHGCFPELAARTGGVRLVPPDDAEALAAGLEALLRDPEARRRLGQEGMCGVRERCRAEDAARDTLRVWERAKTEAAERAVSGGAAARRGDRPADG